MGKKVPHRLLERRQARSACGSSFCRRAKASSRRTSTLPCSAARLVIPRILRCSASSEALLSSKSEPADHRCEKIVEIVRDSAGELADRIHLLRLDELAFERSLVGDVGQRARELDRTAVAVLQQHGLVEEVLVAAVGALPAIFDRQPTGLPPGLDAPR